MSGENVSNYKEQGGARTVIGGSLDVVSGGDLDIESGASLKIAGVAITSSAAELNSVDITSPGTVQASKVVVVDSSKNIGDFNNLDAVNIDAGASGVAGTVDIFPGTAANGKLAITCANQGAGNFTETVTMDQHTQATVTHIPDPGAVAASYLAQSTAALSLAEVDVLQQATAGTVVASKAVVVDSNKDSGYFRNLNAVNVGAGQNGAGGSTGTVVWRNGGNPGTEINVGYAHAAFLTVTTAGTVEASKVLVVGANKNVDTLAIADSGLKLGAGAGTAVTATAVQLNRTAVTTAGTVEASKVLVVGTNKNLDTLAIADSGLKLGAGAGTAVTATAVQLNRCAVTTAGDVEASKVLVCGASKELDSVHAETFYLGAGAGTQVTATAAQLNRAAVTTAGTVEASKILVVGANKNVDTLAIADGGLALGAGAGTAVTALAAELNKLDGAPLAISWAIAAEDTTNGTIDIVCQLQDGAGVDVAVRGSVDIYLSDDANGDSLVTTAPDGGWAILTDGLLIPVVANKYARFVSESDGDIGIRVTESGAKTMYAVAILPTGKLSPSGAITFAT